MADIKTQKNDASVEDFLNSVENGRRKQDSFTVLQMMKEITGSEPNMWGDSIVGFGDYHYKYASGRENDWFKVGFSPRKQSLTLYLMNGFESYGEILSRLGKHKNSKSCLYINKLTDVDLDVLKELITASVTYLNEKYD